MKLLALKVVFTSLNFAPSAFKEFSMRGVKLGYLLQNTRIRPLKRKQPRETVACVSVSYPILVAGIGELRFCSQWAFKHAPLSRILFLLARLSCFQRHRFLLPCMDRESLVSCVTESESETESTSVISCRCTDVAAISTYQDWRTHAYMNRPSSLLCTILDDCWMMTVDIRCCHVAYLLTYAVLMAYHSVAVKAEQRSCGAPLLGWEWEYFE